MKQLSIDNVMKWFKFTNSTLTASSYSAMVFNLKRVEKVLGSPLNELNEHEYDTLYNVAMFNKMEEGFNYSLATQIQTTLAVINILKYIGVDEKLIIKWQHRLATETNERKQKIEKQELSPREKENWIDFDVLQELFYEYVNTCIYGNEDILSYNEIRNVVLMGMYVLIPPARITNYEKMKVREEKVNSVSRLQKKFNYIVKMKDGGMSLCFNQYKTAKLVGQQIGNIESMELIKLINVYLPMREKFVNKKTNTWFFVNKDKNQMSQTNITDTLKCISRKITTKELSANMFRHIFLTDWGKSDHTIAENKRVATFMGQSYSPTMMEKYKKYETTDDDTFKKSVAKSGFN